jgi:hypothetical protein
VRQRDPVRSKRLLLLDHLEQLPGQHYTEVEVNDALGAVHSDFAAIRRYLVDDGLLESIKLRPPAVKALHRSAS